VTPVGTNLDARFISADKISCDQTNDVTIVSADITFAPYRR